MSSVKIPFVFLRFLAFMNMDTGTSKYLLVFKILQTLGEMVRTLTFSDISKFSLIAPGSISWSLAFWQQLSVLLHSQHLHVTNLTTNNRTKHELCSELTIKTPEQCHWRCCGVFIVNFQHISHLVLVFLLLTWSRLMLAALVVVLVNYHQ